MSAVSAELARIEDRVRAAQGKGGRLYWVVLACAVAATATGIYSWSRIIRFGMGETGLNRPVSWGVLITDFVFWVGIAHSGTLDLGHPLPLPRAISHGRVSRARRR